MRCHKCNENRSTFEELFAHLSGCKGIETTAEADTDPLPFEPSKAELEEGTE